MKKQTNKSIRLDSIGGYMDNSTTPHLTPKQSARNKRNESIRHDFNTQIKIYGSTTMGVVAYLSKKYKVSEATIFRCVK